MFSIQLGDAVDLHAERPGNLEREVHYELGDVTNGFETADLIVEEAFHSAEVTHVQMEPNATVADYDPAQVESAVDAAVETNGWPVSAASTTLQYLQADGSWSSTVGPEGCANQVLLVTITIADPDSGLQRRIEVVKGEF